MSSQTKFHSAAIVSVTIVLTVFAVKWFGDPGEAPATSISSQHDERNGRSDESSLTHQPTILRAQATHVAPVEEPPTPPPTNPGFKAYVGDEGSSTWCDASSATFLPLPSDDGLKQ